MRCILTTLTPNCRLHTPTNPLFPISHLSIFNFFKSNTLFLNEAQAYGRSVMTSIPSDLLALNSNQFQMFGRVCDSCAESAPNIQPRKELFCFRREFEGPKQTLVPHRAVGPMSLRLTPVDCKEPACLEHS